MFRTKKNGGDGIHTIPLRSIHSLKAAVETPQLAR